MFNLIKGAKISENISLKEEYEINGNWIYANISAENIRRIINQFIEIENTELFCLFIEIPANMTDENVIRKTEDGYCVTEKMHKDIYYLDDISAKDLNELLNVFEDILINDGLSSFGVLSQKGNEIGKYKYNVMGAYSDGEDLSPIIEAFYNVKIPRTDKLVIAWDYFTQDNPGESVLYKKDGKTIYDVVETLEEIGLYKYEQREE